MPTPRPTPRVIRHVFAGQRLRLWLTQEAALGTLLSKDRGGWQALPLGEGWLLRNPHGEFCDADGFLPLEMVKLIKANMLAPA